MIQVMNLFKRNLPAKIVALFAAVILWFFVMNDQNPSIDGSFTVPLTVLHAPTGCKITQSEETVKIRLHRARARLRQALQNECVFYQDEHGKLACDRR